MNDLVLICGAYIAGNGNMVYGTNSLVDGTVTGMQNSAGAVFNVEPSDDNSGLLVDGRTGKPIGLDLLALMPLASPYVSPYFNWMLMLGTGDGVAINSTSSGLYTNPSKIVVNRIDGLSESIPVNAQGRITMGVAIVENENGVRSLLVSTSEPRGYLRPGVNIGKDEVMVSGTGHAEADLVQYATNNNLKIIDIGATRPVCSVCQTIISPTKANISTPLK